MPWFKVDDNLAFHPKSIRAGNGAMGLWVRAGSWCAQQLTDGYVPADVVPMLGTATQASKLVSVGLWHPVEGGFRFHEWEERQPNKVTIEEERAAARERMRKIRAGKKGVKSEKPQVSGSRSGELRRTGSDVFGNPDPSHPDPSRKEMTTSSLRTPEHDGFDAFWEAYPKKADKGAARRAWAKAVKVAEVSVIIAGARAYAQHPDTHRDGGRYIKNPATWLNAESWGNELPRPTAAAAEAVSPWDRKYVRGPE